MQYFDKIFKVVSYKRENIWVRSEVFLFLRNWSSIRLWLIEKNETLPFLNQILDYKLNWPRDVLSSGNAFVWLKRTEYSYGEEFQIAGKCKIDTVPLSRRTNWTISNSFVRVKRVIPDYITSVSASIYICKLYAYFAKISRRSKCPSRNLFY